MIKRATPADLETVMEWGRKFHAYSPWGARVPIVEEDWRQTVSNLLASEDAAIFFSDVRNLLRELKSVPDERPETWAARNLPPEY